MYVTKCFNLIVKILQSNSNYEIHINKNKNFR